MARGAREVASGEIGPAESGQRRHRPRHQREGLREERLRLLGSALVEQEPAEPDQRREIVGPQGEHLPECRLGAVCLALALVQVREVVGPANFVARQSLRVHIARLRGVEIPGRLKQHPVLAVRRRQLRLRRAAVGDLPGQRLVPLACLRLHGGINTRQIRQRDREERGPAIEP